MAALIYDACLIDRCCTNRRVHREIAATVLTVTFSSCVVVAPTKSRTRVPAAGNCSEFMFDRVGHMRKSRRCTRTTNTQQQQ